MFSRNILTEESKLYTSKITCVSWINHFKACLIKPLCLPFTLHELKCSKVSEVFTDRAFTHPTQTKKAREYPEGYSGKEVHPTFHTNEQVSQVFWMTLKCHLSCGLPRNCVRWCLTELILVLCFQKRDVSVSAALATLSFLAEPATVLSKKSWFSMVHVLPFLMVSPPVRSCWWTKGVDSITWRTL